VAGAPGRKVSIYTEGCLLAFVTDVMILKATANKYGLDEVMKRLFFNYAQKGNGVSENDYKAELEAICGHSFNDFFRNFIHGTSSYEAIITEALEYIGLGLKHFPSRSYAAARLGFKFVPTGQNFLVAAMYAGGPAELCGLMLNDEIIAVNGYSCGGELDRWLNYFDEDRHLRVFHSALIDSFNRWRAENSDIASAFHLVLLALSLLKKVGTGVVAGQNERERGYVLDNGTTFGTHETRSLRTPFKFGRN
jgi:predicted metalloprotease with PDZ domain